MRAFSPLNDNEPDGEVARKAPLEGLFKLVLKGAVLALCVFATLAAFVIAVPEGNDYALATLLKHERLAQPYPRKIVLVGGSNLAFGVDSAIIERATGCPVVNMGMNGFFGVRYMLEEVKPFLHPSDAVIVAFEHDNWFKSVDGEGKDLFVIAKTNPAALSYLSFRQIGSIVAAMPFIAQKKLERIVYEFEANLRGIEREEDEDDLDMDLIETLAGFERHGDLTSHLGVAGAERLDDGLDASNLAFEEKSVELIEEFAKDMNSAGVPLLVSYTSTIRDYYERHGAALDAVHARIAASPVLIAPSSPADFVYERPLFFDTVYHLNAEGRPIRSRKLADDLLKTFGDRARCAPDGSPIAFQ